jgi:hypothetical protein
MLINSLPSGNDTILTQLQHREKWIFIAFDIDGKKGYEASPTASSNLKTVYYSDDLLDIIKYFVVVVYNDRIDVRELINVLNRLADQPTLIFYHHSAITTLNRIMNSFDSMLPNDPNEVGSNVPLPIAESDAKHIVLSHVKGINPAPQKVQILQSYIAQENPVMSFIKNDLKSNIWADASLKRILFYIALHRTQSLSQIESRVTVRFGDSAFSKLSQLEEARSVCVKGLKQLPEKIK